MNPPGPDFLRWKVHDTYMRYASAPPDHKLMWAQRLVEAKFARGDYSDILQALDDATRDAMARALVDGKG